MEEEEKLPPARALDEYSLNQLEVKRRKCQEDLQDIIKYSWGHRVSDKIGHDVYKIMRNLSIIGVILFIVSFILMMLPVIINMIDKTERDINPNFWVMGLFLGGIMLFMFPYQFFLNDPAKPLRRKLADLDQVIRIKQEVEQGDNFTLDEDGYTEYKSSFKYDIKTKNPNSSLVKDVIISILGFLNTNGGRVVIGISDSKEILGIENDLKIFGNWDKFQLAIHDALRCHSDKPISEFIRIRKVKKDEKELCEISTRPYSKPVFFVDGNNNDLYVRNGNQTIKLSTKEALDYVTSHWIEKKF